MEWRSYKLSPIIVGSFIIVAILAVLSYLALRNGESTQMMQVNTAPSLTDNSLVETKNLLNDLKQTLGISVEIEKSEPDPQAGSVDWRESDGLLAPIISYGFDYNLPNTVTLTTTDGAIKDSEILVIKEPYEKFFLSKGFSIDEMNSISYDVDIDHPSSLRQFGYRKDEIKCLLGIIHDSSLNSAVLASCGVIDQKANVLRKQFTSDMYSKDHLQMKDMAVNVNLIVGEFAKGTTTHGEDGHRMGWIAKRNNGKWQEIIGGIHEAILCTDVDKFDFEIPREIYNDCVEADGFTMRFE